MGSNLPHTRSGMTQQRCRAKLYRDPYHLRRLLNQSVNPAGLHVSLHWLRLSRPKCRVGGPELPGAGMDGSPRHQRVTRRLPGRPTALDGPDLRLPMPSEGKPGAPGAGSAERCPGAAACHTNRAAGGGGHTTQAVIPRGPAPLVILDALADSPGPGPVVLGGSPAPGPAAGTLVEPTPSGPHPLAGGAASTGPRSGGPGRVARVRPTGYRGLRPKPQGHDASRGGGRFEGPARDPQEPPGARPPAGTSLALRQCGDRLPAT